MAVTLTSVNDALKSYYLNAAAEQINKASPFYAKIKHSTENVYGKEIKKFVSYGVNGGIGAGTEDGNLPPAQASDYKVFTSTLKNLYGTIEISDKAIRASENSQGAFVNLLNAEMENLVNTSKFNMQRMLFGDGTGKVAETVAVVNGEIKVDTVAGLREGMIIDFVSTQNAVISGATGRKITKVVRGNEPSIFVDGTTLTNTTVTSGSYIVIQGSLNNEIKGLEYIFTNNNLYGTDDSLHYAMKPVTQTSSSVAETTLQKMLDRLDEVEAGTNLILCSYGVRRKLFSTLANSSRLSGSMDIEGGFKAISYNGIPVIADKFCPTGTMYFLNTDDFVMYELCDWEWLTGDNGQILKQVAGKPVYTATLVKYAELMCSRPHAQGKMSGISEA